MPLLRTFPCCAVFVLSLGALGQACPRENPKGPNFDSQELWLDGTAVFHNGLRRWMELKPKEPVCGNSSIQLLQGSGGGFEVDEGDSLQLEALRGCHIAVKGKLGIPATGYYSAPLYFGVIQVRPGAGCRRQPAIPTYWYAQPDASVQRYRVSMVVNYKGEGSVRATIRSGARSLAPWQAYASYWLTGSHMLYAYCGKGFHLSEFQGTPEAKPDVIDDEVSMDPEGAAQMGVWHLRLDFNCRR